MANKVKPKKNTLKSKAVSKKTTGKKSNPLAFFSSREFKTSMGIFLLLFTLLFAFACFSYLSTWKDDDPLFQKGFFDLMFRSDAVSANLTGKFGSWIAYIFIKRWFGVASLLFIPIFIMTGLNLLGFEIKRFRFKLLLIFSYILFLSVLFGALFTRSDLTIMGGTFGCRSSHILINALGKIGLFLLLIFSALVLISITVPVFYFKIIEKIRNIRLKKSTAEQTAQESTKDQSNTIIVTDNSLQQNNIEGTDEEETTISHEGPIELTTSEKEQTESIGQSVEKESASEVPFEIIISENQTEETNIPAEATVSVTEDGEFSSDTLNTPYDPRKDLESYVFPDIDLLREYGSGLINIDKAELEGNKNKIENTLHNYGISIDRIFATVGPTVTLYEIVPSPGVRISKIKNLEDDIALSLAALGIRIIAPIPGKGTIGIEVPNKNPETVSFKSLIVSTEYQNSTFDLPVALGKTIDNKPYIADLTKMPHLLMAGATGQGKSVGLNTIIASLLYKKHPSELKFVLVDPKKVELPLFAKIERHFLAKLPDAEDAIITDTKQVVRTLKALTIEMDQRYDLLKDAMVRNIKEYNEKFIARRLNPKKDHMFLPYIVLIVDEFADLIMTAGKEIEGPIARIAQLARAVGIHLVIATQRPSVNIITGIIKANFPARMAFRVSAKVDSRTIIDTSGADQLIGRGDMLLSNGSRIDRLQCAYIDTAELEDIAEFIGSQRGYPSAFALPEVVEEEGDGMKDFDPEDRDPMFAEAARVIVQNQHGSTSLLQRKLKLGYNRAGRLIDQLEAAGIVGPFEGSKAREVLIKDMITLEQLLTNFNNI
jgi:DNA segregation ATPase FtsK/SpoIIIE, S-DNA-T family